MTHKPTGKNMNYQKWNRLEFRMSEKTAKFYVDNVKRDPTQEDF